MQIKYLGTAAAEGWPALFCRCDSCKLARSLGGKDIRTRSQALIDGQILLDLPPDTYMHFLSNPDFDLAGIEHLFVTHSHSDHFYALELAMRCEPFGLTERPMLTVYGNQAVEEAFYSAYKTDSRLESCIRFKRVKPFESVVANGYTVTPLKALHDPAELCFVYLIEDSTHSLLYCHDSGILPDEDWAFLKGRHVDLVSLDCTCQSQPDGGNHMGLADNVTMKNRLIAEGIADESTIFICSHFSHNGLWQHEKITAEAAKHNILAAYDGMLVTI